MNFIS